MFINPTGIYDEENKEKLLSVYPNPTKEKIYIDKKLIVNSICLFNLNGKLIQSFEKNSTTLNLSNIPNGQYILKIETPKGVFNESIIKE